MKITATLILITLLLGSITTFSQKVATPTLISSSNGIISKKVSEMKTVSDEEWQLMIEKGKETKLLELTKKILHHCENETSESNKDRINKIIS